MSALDTIMQEIGQSAKAAARVLSLAPTAQKNQALHAMAKAIRAKAQHILTANQQDLDTGKTNGLNKAALDRLALTPARIEAMAQGIEGVEALHDPVGEITSQWQRPNGLTIARIRTPIGVIGVIYESRPNVTADAGALCLKSGNAVILRGGSDSFLSSQAIHACLEQGLQEAGLPKAAITLVPTTDRAAVGLMLQGLNQTIDVIVPRGGKSLVARVQQEARVPIFAHLDGNCHIYIHQDADLDMALNVTKNAKLRRTGVCGAAETLLIDDACVKTHLAPLITMLLDNGCEIRGDEKTQSLDPRVKPASLEDYQTEFLDAIIAVKVVQDLSEAIDHIAQFGSHHTDAIITNNQKAAQQFLTQIDSAIVVHNASTQFADGGEFGFGSEIGIATGKMHARGPVGLEQLCTFKYIIHGTGQIRPL
jgi:glutamate-5-semialdehyde dehydrogenase